METAINKCACFAEALSLRSEADGLFIGKIRGFPIGLKFIEPIGATVLLFHVRHLLSSDSAQLKSLSYDIDITNLINEKKLEIEFDNRIAWLTFIDGNKCMEDGTGLRLLNSVLQTFGKAGLIGDLDLCHYCQKEKVASVACVEGKAVQICRTCLEERVSRVARETTDGAAETVPIFLMSPFASLVGALMWATVWAAHTWLFELTTARAIFLPRIVELVGMLGIGLLVGGPVGWIIKKNRKRGHAISVSAAVLFSTLAVILGEVFYLVWLIYHEVAVVSFSAALHIMPEYYLHNDGIYLATKALTAFVSVAVAYMIAKPERPKLKL